MDEEELENEDVVIPTDPETPDTDPTPSDPSIPEGETPDTPDRGDTPPEPEKIPTKRVQYYVLRTRTKMLSEEEAKERRIAIYKHEQDPSQPEPEPIEEIELFTYKSPDEEVNCFIQLDEELFEEVEPNIIESPDEPESPETPEEPEDPDDGIQTTAEGDDTDPVDPPTDPSDPPAEPEPEVPEEPKKEVKLPEGLEIIKKITTQEELYAYETDEESGEVEEIVVSYDTTLRYYYTFYTDEKDKPEERISGICNECKHCVLGHFPFHRFLCKQHTYLDKITGLEFALPCRDFNEFGECELWEEIPPEDDTEEPEDDVPGFGDEDDETDENGGSGDSNVDDSDIDDSDSGVGGDTSDENEGDING